MSAHVSSSQKSSLASSSASSPKFKWEKSCLMTLVVGAHFLMPWVGIPVNPWRSYTWKMHLRTWALTRCRLWQKSCAATSNGDPVSSRSFRMCEKWQSSSTIAVWILCISTLQQTTSSHACWIRKCWRIVSQIAGLAHGYPDESHAKAWTHQGTDSAKPSPIQVVGGGL